MFGQRDSIWTGTGPRWPAWKSLLLIGINLIVLAVLIFLFPALLAYLIAAFLLFNGSFLLLAAYYLRAAEKRMSEEGQVFWEWSS